MDDSLCERTPPEQPAAPAVPRPPVRIGVILLDEDIKLPSLKFLIVSMNRMQTSFEYEILPPIDDHPLLNGVCVAMLRLDKLKENK